MGLNELLPKAVRLYPEKEAVVCGELRMNYREFAARVWRLAHGLQGLGIVKGDRIAVLHENTHEYLEAYFAAAHMGVILVSLNYRLATKELTGNIRGQRITDPHCRRSLSRESKRSSRECVNP